MRIWTQSRFATKAEAQLVYFDQEMATVSIILAIAFFILQHNTACGEITAYITACDSYSVTIKDNTTNVEGLITEPAVLFHLPNENARIFIESQNSLVIGGILASFSTGMVTDASWECIAAGSSSNSVWPSAVSLGFNDGTVYNVIEEINLNAEWIWTNNVEETVVVCRKNITAIGPRKTQRDDLFSFEHYTKEESFSIASQQCARLGGHVMNLTTFRKENKVNSTLKIDIKWFGFLFSNATFRWYNDTEAQQVIECFIRPKLTAQQCSVLEWCNKETGICPLENLSTHCADDSCQNISVVVHICTEGVSPVSSSIAISGSAGVVLTAPTVPMSTTSVYQGVLSTTAQAAPSSTAAMVSTTVETTSSPYLSSSTPAVLEPESTSSIVISSTTATSTRQPLFTKPAIENYERMLDEIDLETEEALSDIVRITTMYIDGSLEESTTEEVLNLALTGLFENKLVSYAARRLNMVNETVTRVTKNFVIQIKKMSSSTFSNENGAFLFPSVDETTRTGYEMTTIHQDFISVPEYILVPDAIFVGVLYLTLDQSIDRSAVSLFPEEKLNTRIISAEVYPRPEGVLKQNVSFMLSHKNETGYGSNCVFFEYSTDRDKNKSFSNAGCSIIFTNESHTTCTCDHMTSFAVLTRVHSDALNSVSRAHSKALSVITYVGISLSLFGEAVTVASYVLLIGLKTDQSHLHTNLAWSLGLAQISFLVAINITPAKAACVLVAALVHYFYLVTFCWMLVEGYHLYLMVVKVFHEESYLKKYYLFSWVLPVVIVVSCLIGAAALPQGIYSYTSDDICWVSSEFGFIWGFLGPVLLVCLMNFVLLTLVVKEMTRMNKGNEGPSLHMRKSVKACLLLFPILGTTWVFCVLVMTTSSLVIEYLFTILNSAQGLLIFLFHVIRSSELRSVFERRRRQWNNSMEISNHYITSTEKAKTAGKQTPPVSMRSIKPIVEKWVDVGTPESPEMFHPNGRSNRNKIMPEIESG